MARILCEYDEFDLSTSITLSSAEAEASVKTNAVILCYVMRCNFWPLLVCYLMDIPVCCV